MGKLFNLKEWLTVADAARHLSIVFGEEVTEADVLRLGLDGRLGLSVYFVNHATARCGEVVEWEGTDWCLFPNIGDATRTGRKWSEKAAMPVKLKTLLDSSPAHERENYLPLMLSLDIGGRFLTLSDSLRTLRGVWDLPMVGNERLDVEHQYQKLTGGPAVTLLGLDGTFVEGRNGQICQLQESYDENVYEPGSSAALERLNQRIADDCIPADEAQRLVQKHAEARKKFLEETKLKSERENHYPAGSLPHDAVIVVRTEALRAFEESINGAADTVAEKPITTSERASLLIIIAGLCNYSAIDLKERGAASQIARLTEEIGAPVSDDTVRRVLAKIPDAVESRMK